MRGWGNWSPAFRACSEGTSRARTASYPQGWTQLVFELFKDIDRLLNDDQATSFETLQVKEKFGRLRVRVRYRGTLDEAGGPEAQLRALVAAAGDQSETVCQVCGRLSNSNRPPLWNVACAACCAIRSRAAFVAEPVGKKGGPTQ